MRQGVHHPTGSQQAFLPGLAPWDNVGPDPRGATPAGHGGVAVAGGPVPTQDWFLTLHMRTSAGLQGVTTPLHHYIGLNLAKGDFPANEDRSRAQIGRALARKAGRNVHNSALGDRPVRTKHLLRSFEHTEGLNPSERAVELGENGWPNGQSELLMRIPVQLGSLLSGYLAEFLSFARLRPNSVECGNFGEVCTVRLSFRSRISALLSRAESTL